MRRSGGRSVAISLFMTAALVFSFLFAPVAISAAPTTPTIQAKQKEAVAASAKLQSLNDDLESKREDYLAVTEALQSTRDDIASAETSLTQTQQQLDAAQGLLAGRVDEMYRNGSVDILQVLLGTTSFNDFLTRLDMLNRISASDADLVAQVTTARDAVAQVEASLQDREAEQVALREKADQAQQLVQTAVAQQSSYVASLNAQVKNLIKQEQDRLAAIAAAKARAASRSGGYSSARSSDVADLGAPHPGAADEAKKFLGVPYVWGGESPSGFDCSGLAQYCYAQIGISIPRTAREQFKIGKFIPPDRTDVLAPGDLVFFGTNGDPNLVHHVGIYVGGGSFINAPATGEVVSYALLSDRSDYVGAVRP